MRVSRVVAAIAAVLVATVGLAVPAQAATTGTISVKVVYPGGVAVTTGCLNLKKTGTPTATYQDCTPTSGTFSVANLPFGYYEYTVTGFPGYIQPLTGSDEIWSEMPTLSVTRMLEKSGTVTGVISQDGGAPIAGATVRLFEAGDDFSSLSTPLATTTTSATGAYTVSSPKVATVSVVVTGPSGFGTQFLGWEYLSAGAVVTKNASMQAAGTIEGTIVAPPSVTGSSLCVVAAPANRLGYEEAKDCGAPGEPFSLDVAPGQHAVCVSNQSAAPSCSPTSGNKASWFRSAEAISVTSATATTVELDWGGTLDVTVSPDNGEGLVGGCLAVNLGAAGTVQSCTHTDGVFSFDFDENVSSGNAATTLTGATNVADTSWSSVVRVDGGRTQVITKSVRARGTGAVNLAVELANGSPITAGCAVLEYAPPLTGKVAEDCAITDGTASFTGLPAADYVVRTTGVPGTLSSVWYPAEGSDSTPHTAIEVAAGATVVLDMVLPTTLTLAGTVADAEGPRSDGSVQFIAGGQVVAETAPAEDGSYALTVPIVTGDLRVAGFAGAADAFYGDAYVASQAADQGGPSASGLAVAGRDFALKPAATLTGVLAAPGAIAGSDVCIRAQVDGGNQAFGAPACGAVGAPFSIPVVPGKSYNLCVQASNAVTQCGNSRAQSDFVGTDGAPKAYAVAAGGGDVAAGVAFGGSLVATVTAGTSVLSGGCAVLEDNGVEVGRSCAPVGQTFTITLNQDSSSRGLVVRFEGVRGVLYAAKSIGDDVTAGETTTVTVVAQPWPKFVGTITRPAGAANTRACVFATDLDGVFETACLEPGTSAYSLTVPPGRYVLQFFTEEADAAWEWYNNVSTIDAATWVTIDEGSQTISATLAPQAIIRGHVSTANGADAADGCAVAYGADGRPAGSDCSIDGGDYEINSLPAGTYRVKFTGFDASAQRWYTTGTTFASAKTITLAAGASATANVTLTTPSTLRGVVTYASAGATGGCVEVIAADGYTVADTCALTNGAYEFTDLPSGTYSVLFAGFDGAADLYYGGTIIASSATKVTVSPSAAKTVNMTLGKGGSISGSTTQYELGPGDFSVELYDTQGRFVRSLPLEPVESDEGTVYPYTFDHLAAGTYKVAVVRDKDGFLAWRRASGAIAPERIAVPAGSSWNVTGKTLPDVTSLDGGFVYGKLNVPSTWTSSTVCAVAVSSAGTAIASDCGPKGSAFVLSRLESGSGYWIVFTNGEIKTSAQYKAFTGAKRWWGNKTASSTAPRFTFQYNEWAWFPVWFYSDVNYGTKNYWQISWMGDNNIYRPSAGTYRPTSTLTRRDLAIYLYKAAGSPAVTLPSKSPFVDVPKTDSAYKALLWMRSKKIWTSTTYKPTAGVTKRIEAYILYRAAGSPAVTLPSKNPFTDIKSSDSAYKAVIWANKYKIVPKTSSTKYGAATAVTRGSGAGSLYEWWWRFG